MAGAAVHARGLRKAYGQRVAVDGIDLEVRRGEWVHFLSAFTFLLIVPFNPWQLILLWFCIVFIGNMVFFLVLRYNQLRLTSILARMGG
jgi:hypothetical protein